MMSICQMLSLACLVPGDVPPELPRTETRRQYKPEDAFPKESEYWDEIGTYRLKGDRRVVTIKLYYRDSDSVADKVDKQGRFSFRTYPNFFAIHAIYQEGTGPWKHAKLYSVARVGFGKVGNPNPESVKLLLRSKAIIFARPGQPIDKDLVKRLAEPIGVTLTVKNGIPVIE
jgi:hypothetical protein